MVSPYQPYQRGIKYGVPLSAGIKYGVPLSALSSYRRPGLSIFDLYTFVTWFHASLRLRLRLRDFGAREG